MKKSITLDMKTYIHMVDALNAAKNSGLKSDTEQLAFDQSLYHAGGLLRLNRKTGIPFIDNKIIFDRRTYR